jgi:hypothetical protein
VRTGVTTISGVLGHGRRRVERMGHAADSAWEKVARGGRPGADRSDFGSWVREGDPTTVVIHLVGR